MEAALSRSQENKVQDWSIWTRLPESEDYTLKAPRRQKVLA
jgi:hypothetical protein